MRDRVHLMEFYYEDDHVLAYCERCGCDGEPMPDEDIAEEAFLEVFPACDPEVRIARN